MELLLPILIIGLIFLYLFVYWRGDSDEDLAQYYKDEYRNEYLQRDKSDKDWWKHLNLHN